jgi:uncharacterized protein YbjT (DUF2867 family)
VRILILGASGGCGRWATRLAAEAGHDVTALVREGTPFEPPRGVGVRRGSLLGQETLSSALDGQEAVISCVGPQRVNPRNPWSPLRPPLHVAEASAKALVDAVPRSTARRIAAISAAGVGDSLDNTNAMMRWMLRHSTVGQMYADLEGMEGVLRASPLDWVAVRPVVLIDVKPSRRRPSTGPLPGVSIRRGSAARRDAFRWLIT